MEEIPDYSTVAGLQRALMRQVEETNMWRHTCIEAARVAAAQVRHPDAADAERALCGHVVWLCAFGESPYNLSAVYEAAGRLFATGKWEHLDRLRGRLEK